MAPKKKGTRPESVSANNVRLRQRLHQVLQDHFHDEDRIAELEALLKSGQETMREHAKVVVELSEALRIAKAELAMKELQLDNFEGTIRALEAQNEYWQDEAQRLRDRLVLQLAEEARNRKPTAVED